MEIGDTIDVRGPSGRLIYHGRGDFEIKAVKRKDPSHNLFAKKLTMIAGINIILMVLIIFCLRIQIIILYFDCNIIRWYRYYTNVTVDKTNYKGP